MEQKPEKLHNTAALSLGFNMAAGMGIFTYIGYKIDQRQGGGSSWTLAGMFLGLLYCAYEIWKLLRQNNKD